MKGEPVLNVDKKPYIALFLLTSIMLLIILVYANQRTIEYDRAQKEITDQYVVRTATTEISDSIHTSVTDVTLLIDSLHSILSSEKDENVKLEEIQKLFLTFSKMKPEYTHVRLVSILGQELINVKNETIPIANDPSPIDYTEFDYFSESAQLLDGFMYITDFNIQPAPVGASETFSTSVEFCMPVYKNDSVYAVLILTAKTDSLFRSLKYISSEFNTNLDLLNKSSQWISTTTLTPENEYLFPEYENGLFLNIYPEEWGDMVRSKTGTVNQNITDKGMFTYSKINFNDILDKTTDNVGKVVFQEPVAYLTAYTLVGEDDENIFIDSNFEYLIYTIESNGFYTGLILLISLLTTAMFYYRGVYMRKIKFHSDYDALTSIYNRRAGMTKVRSILNTAGTSHLPVSVCFLDINGLKIVNDTLGHQYGDELIITVTKVIKKTIKQNDIVMRVGGDEFVVVLLNCPETEAEDVWVKVEEEFYLINQNENREYNISVSHGIKEYNYHDDSELDNILTVTDQIMYENKKDIKRTFNALKK